MNKPFPASVLLLALAACSSAGGTSRDDAGEFRARLGEARQLLDEGRFDEALSITDEVIGQDPDNVRARLLAAEGNRAIFLSGRSLGQTFLQDAIRNLEAALAVRRDPQALLLMADLRLKNAEFEAGREAALAAAAMLRERGAGEAEIARAVLAAADNDMQVFVDVRRREMAEGSEQPTAESAELAQAVLARLAFAKRGAPGEAHARTAQVYQWLGDTKAALEELERGIDAAPADASIHEAYQALYFDLDRRAAMVRAYEKLAEQHAGVPLVLWYLGRARVGLADQHRSQSNWEDAIAVYRQAEQSFAQYGGRVPAHAGSAREWQAICKLSVGRCLAEAGSLDEAKETFFAAAELSPKVTSYDAEGRPALADSFGGNYLSGLYRIGTAIASTRSGAVALREALELYEAVLERHPGEFGTMYNNAALAARDLGVAVAAAGDQEAAKELWERSYRFYEQAVELEGDDPRIVNDAGLMLNYHLHRDHERARELFERAIELGEAQLAALPADADEGTRQFLEEATGDAHQNIGVMLRQQGEPFSVYAPHLRKAIEFYPYQRREAARMLRAGEAGAQRGDAQSTTGGRGADDDLAKAFAAPLAEAQAAAAKSPPDYDTALIVLDRVARRFADHAPYHYWKGRYSFEYAERSIASNGNAGQIDGLLADAARAMTRAIELDGDPLEPRLELARIELQRGAFAGAADAALSLLSHARSIGGASAEIEQAAQRLLAEASTRVYIDAKQQERDAPDALATARDAFRALEAADALDADLVRTWVTLEQWAGAGQRALELLVGAAQRLPRDHELLAQLVELAASEGRSEVAAEAFAGRDDATGSWYRGWARFNRAQELWAGKETAAALDALAAARADFTAAKTAEPTYAASSDQWIAMSLGSEGLIHLGEDRLGEAEAVLLEAVELRPDTFENPLGGGNTIKRALRMVADRHFRAGDLARTESVLYRAGELVPGDVDIANDHGLMARDLGDRLRRAGDEQQAMRAYERSLASYERALAHDPDNVRLANDTALLLLYGVRRDPQRAEAILQDALARGRGQLDEDPPAQPQQLRDLQEAVGDCHQNLGYLYMTFTKDLHQARTHLQQSLGYYPGEQRASARHLERLEVIEKEAREEAKRESGDRDGFGFNPEADDRDAAGRR